MDSATQLPNSRGLVITGPVKLFCLLAYIPGRGAKRFGDDKIRLSVTKTKWTGLSNKSRAFINKILILYNIWLRAPEITRTFDKRAIETT